MTTSSIKSKEDATYVVPSDALIPIVNNAGTIAKSVTPTQLVAAGASGTMDFSAFGVTYDGTDETVKMQLALNSPVNLVAQKNKTIITSATLFNQIPNRTIDLNGSTIVNLTNSKFALVTVTEQLTTQTDAALAILLTENHFANQIENSHVLNAKCQMLPNTGSGANLGLGIVYGKYCELTGEVISSNGNGAHIQGSLSSKINLKIRGCRSFNFFNYQCKNTDIQVDVDGGTRGIEIKHAYYDDGDLNIRIHDSIIMNTTDRAIGGGFSADTGASTALEPAGHEHTGQVLVESTYIGADSSVSALPTIKIGNHCEGWEFNNTVIDNQSTSTGGTMVSVGGEGSGLTYFNGGGHRLKGLSIQGAAGLNSTVINSVATVSIQEVDISGEFGNAIRFDPLTLSTDDRVSLVSGCNFTGSLGNGDTFTSAGIHCQSGTKNINIDNNSLNLTASENTDVPTRTKSVGIGNAGGDIIITNNRINLTVDSAEGVSEITALYTDASGEAITTGNVVTVTNDTDTIPIYGINDVSGNSAITSNRVVIEQNATTPGTSLGIRYTTGTTSVANNVFNGSWTTNEVAV